MPKNPTSGGRATAAATPRRAAKSTRATTTASKSTASKAKAGPAKATTGKAAPLPSERRDHLVTLSAELFAEKGFRATTVREIADAAGILSGSLYHHFSSKESIADEILSKFLNEVLADYRAALEEGGDPRTTLGKIARTGFDSLERHRAAIMMLQNDWNYFREQSRFGYLQKTLAEVERIWIGELKRGVKDGTFRTDLDPQLTYRLFRDTIWVAVRWYRPGGRLSTKQLADQFSRILFEGIATR
jgi:TetR/AcrR family transcriptional regulator, cholesterol catabolism regulator